MHLAVITLSRTARVHAEAANAGKSAGQHLQELTLAAACLDDDAAGLQLKVLAQKADEIVAVSLAGRGGHGAVIAGIIGDQRGIKLRIVHQPGFRAQAQVQPAPLDAARLLARGMETVVHGHDTLTLDERSAAVETGGRAGDHGAGITKCQIKGGPAQLS